MRRPLSILITALLSLTVLLSAPADAEKNYDHPLIDVEISLRPDGSADVKETRAFRFDGSFSWAFVEKSTRGQYGRYGIEFRGVRDADTGEELRFELYQKNGMEGIKWYYSARDEVREFVISYRITGAVQRYVDAAQFYWQIIGERHAYVKTVRAEIVPPEPSPGLFKVFVHSQAPPGSLDFEDGFGMATVRLSGVPPDEFVELRVLLDPDIFPGAPVVSGESHGSLLEDERRTTGEWRERQARRIEDYRRSQRRIKYSVLAGLLLILSLFLLFLRFFFKYGTEPKIGYDLDYEREPPRDIPPCVLPVILTQSSVQDTQLGKSFSSALIECARLGYLEIRETEKKVLLFKSKKLEYRLTDRGRALLSGDPGASGGERPLIPFEKDVLDVVFNEAGSGDIAESDEVEAWAKKSSGTKTNFKRFMDLRKKSLRSDFERDHFRLDDQESERARKRFVGLSVGAGLVFVVIFFAGLRSPVLFAFAPLVVLIGVLLSIPLSRRTPEAALEHARWSAFKRFMSDFSAMKDAGPSLLPLWEHYLVYAVALGVADKLINNLKLVAREYNTPVPMAAWFYPAHAAGAEGPGDGLSSLDSMTASLSNLEALSSAMTASTSSGGGFSGGGGGGGGGGGSGAG